MPTLPTFNSFSLNDNGFITERIVFKGFAQRANVRAKLNRREGIKLLATEFGEKEITVQGVVIQDTATELQTSLDLLKKNLVTEEGSLVVELGRTYRATASNLVIPDEHYNQSKTNFEVTFVCSDPFATGPLLTVVKPVLSGITNFSGYVNISGTFFVRPTVVYTAPVGDGVGKTRINKLTLSHTPTGQEITVSGFGSGTNLTYNNTVSLNFDTFATLEGSSAKNNGGSFARWEPGENNYIVTFSGVTPGGTITLSYQPRYL